MAVFKATDLGNLEKKKGALQGDIGLWQELWCCPPAGTNLFIYTMVQQWRPRRHTTVVQEAGHTHTQLATPTKQNNDAHHSKQTTENEPPHVTLRFTFLSKTPIQSHVDIAFQVIRPSFPIGKWCEKKNKMVLMCRDVYLHNPYAQFSPCLRLADK